MGRITDDIFHHCYFTKLGLLCIIPDQGFGARKGPSHLIHELDHYYPAALLFRTWPKKTWEVTCRALSLFIIFCCPLMSFLLASTAVGARKNGQRPFWDHLLIEKGQCPDSKVSTGRSVYIIPSERIISTTQISLPWLSTLGYFLSSFSAANRQLLTCTWTITQDSPGLFSRTSTTPGSLHHGLSGLPGTINSTGTSQSLIAMGPIKDHNFHSLDNCCLATAMMQPLMALDSHLQSSANGTFLVLKDT